MKANNDYAFVIYNKTHFKNVCKWIKNLGASKHMTLHRTTFDIYEINVPRNVHLDDNSVFEAMGMESIVMETNVKGQINQSHITDALHVPKLLANLFLVSKLVSNGLKSKST